MTDGEIGQLRKLQIKELNDLYSSLTIARVMKVSKTETRRAVARMGERTEVYRALVGQPEGKVHL